MNSTINLRCQSDTGLFQLEDLTCFSTLEDLHLKISQKLNLALGSFKILYGFPPRALPKEDKNITLATANITSGEKLTIQKLPDDVKESFIEPKEAAILNATGADDMLVKKSYPKSENVTTFIAAGKDTPLNEPLINTKEAATFNALDDVPQTFHNYANQRSGIMLRQVVPSNNSCLFTSISYLVSHGEMDPDNSKNLRQVIARAVAKDPERYNAAFLGMSNSEYCTWIQNNEHWGGAIELSILSDHFGIEIVALDLVNVMIHRFGELKSYTNRIFVIYDGIHYDPLVLELGDGTTQYVFHTSHNHFLDMALEVVKEANSSRQFTDIHNFTLKCMICDKHLRGEEEARTHAMETEHVNFGEIL